MAHVDGHLLDPRIVAECIRLGIDEITKGSLYWYKYIGQADGVLQTASFLLSVSIRIF